MDKLKIVFTLLALILIVSCGQSSNYDSKNNEILQQRSLVEVDINESPSDLLENDYNDLIKKEAPDCDREISWEELVDPFNSNAAVQYIADKLFSDENARNAQGLHPSADIYQQEAMLYRYSEGNVTLFKGKEGISEYYISERQANLGRVNPLLFRLCRITIKGISQPRVLQLVVHYFEPSNREPYVASDTILFGEGAIFRSNGDIGSAFNDNSIIEHYVTIHPIKQ